MNPPNTIYGQRILVIDDNRAIHEDFRKILDSDQPGREVLEEREAMLFGEPTPPARRQVFRIDSAFQGQDGLHLLRQSMESGEPYAMAFVDVRMGPGWDGIETTAKLWEAYPDLQVVICTAHSDYSWDDMVSKLGHSDRLVILKKPFDNVEVQQLAIALTQKWRLLQQARIKVDDLEKIVGLRTEQFQVTNAQLQAEIAERKEVESALRQVAEGIAAATGEEFFRSLVKSLAQALGADYAYVGELAGPEGKSIKTIALCADGKLLETCEYDLANSPAELVLREQLVCCPQGIQTQFPGDRWLAEMKAESFTGTALRDATGRAIGLVAVMNRKPLLKPELTKSMLQIYSVRAATERERKRAEQAIMQQERLAAVGQLSAGLAHDFNNMLCIILGYAALLQEHGEEQPGKKKVDALKQITTAAQRAAHLTRQLLAFSRKQVMQPQSLEFNEVIGNVSRMLQRLVGEDIAVQFHFSPRPVYIHADLGMIEQIVMNLVVNARDAMIRGGQLTLSASVVEIDEAHRQNNPEARPGQFACLSVSDTGCGIPQEHLLRIFEPFFTTKELGKGTGLGLATVYGIVKQHDGWIEVTSEVGKGTTFKVFLPKGTKPAGSQTETFFNPVPRRGDEKILLVEDEAALRGLASKLLRRQGYEIVEAASGVEALEVWEQHAGEFDLLLTDMVMPGGVTGRDLAETLLADKPALKVIFSSGYSTDMVGNNFLLEEEINFLPKPYPPKALIQIVRVCLDRNKEAAGPDPRLRAGKIPNGAGAATERNTTLRLVQR